MVSVMDNYEKLGPFYLGRNYDPESGTVGEQPLLLESRDLTTHAVCIGMTGSGKTGLCISLLEEAAIDGIPSIVIDPKGDLSNLLLMFPGLSTEEFLPWVNPGEAENAGLSLEEYARSQAQLWKTGLEKWGQDASRIQRLRESADFSVYTPGSTAGRPVSILGSLSVPPQPIRADRDLLNEAVESTVTSLLSLLDMNTDPLQSREHILLSNVFKGSWEEGKDLDLGSLIGMIQTPPFSRIGVMNLESFYPAKDRSTLAMRINSLLAAPGFQAWLEGEPLSIDDLLYDPRGKPRVSIISIAHLSETQRMFMVSLLLTQLVSWVRTQPGTSSLRAICYMDEIFGYFPPVANPPSKKPLLTLLKQARASGLGMVLSTQNPVDLDYKGLGNTGTWFIGRLQTQQDQDRVIEGLKDVHGGAGQGSIRETIAGLEKRAFLLNSVHRDHAELFRTRWALSYLRGPLTRNQIKMLAGEGFPEMKAEPVVPARPVPDDPPAAAVPPVLPSYLKAGISAIGRRGIPAQRLGARHRLLSRYQEGHFPPGRVQPSYRAGSQ